MDYDEMLCKSQLLKTVFITVEIHLKPAEIHLIKNNTPLIVVLN